MDEVAQQLVTTGEALRRRSAALDEIASGAAGAAQGLVREAAVYWRVEGDAVAAEGARMRRAAEIVGETTGGGRRPADASRVVVFGIEAEGEALLTTADRLEDRARSLSRYAAQLHAAGVAFTSVPAPGATDAPAASPAPSAPAVRAASVPATTPPASPLETDAKSLQVLAARARRAGQAMLDQARRYRQSLGERVP